MPRFREAFRRPFCRLIQFFRRDKHAYTEIIDEELKEQRRKEWEEVEKNG